MRPVLAIPFLGRAEELRDCLDSIDIPVRLVVVDNTTQGIALDVVDDEAWVIEPPGNLGYAGSINLVIKALPHEPYWLFANHDVVFGPGDLQRLAEIEHFGWVGINDWRVFRLDSDTVLRVGLWDEGFVPAYLEDCDYERRCTVSGVSWGFIDGNTQHIGSLVIRDPEYARKNAISYPDNYRRYIEKWGGFPRGGEAFQSPWDLPVGVDWWPADFERIRRLMW